MIRFENVTKVYDPNARPALDAVNLEIDRGEFTFLVGASGSGKSTFLRLILKEDRASSGAVYVAGQNVAKISSWRVTKLRRGIGVVFQDFRLLPQKTVFPIGRPGLFGRRVRGRPERRQDLQLACDEAAPRHRRGVPGLPAPAAEDRLSDRKTGPLRAPCTWPARTSPRSPAGV